MACTSESYEKEPNQSVWKDFRFLSDKISINSTTKDEECANRISYSIT